MGGTVSFTRFHGLVFVGDYPNDVLRDNRGLVQILGDVMTG